MLSSLKSIRREERLLAWSGFALLVFVMLAHAMLETARDALFLAAIPAEQLPFVYLLVAAAAVGMLGLQKTLQRFVPKSVALPAFLIFGSVATTGIWLTLPALGPPGLYLLYVWTGVLVSLVLVEFWSSLGAALTVQQAKRVFSFVGTGSVAGAIAGFAIAAAISGTFGAQVLLPIASAALLVSAAISFVVARAAEDRTVEPPATTPHSRRELFKRPYVRSIAILVVLMTVTVTLADYIFKATIAEAVPAADLGMWFSTIYLALNIGALLVQTLFAGPIIRALGVTRAVSVLPATLALGAVGTLLGLAVPAAVALKAADGTLRHTLTQTARELLYVPLPSRVRAGVKGLIDVAGQRGGQALASIGILGFVAAGFDPRWLGLVVLVLASWWILHTERMRAPYLAVFRRTLSQLATSRELDYPELDFASLETLILSLNSPDEGRVIAAIEVFEEQGKTNLVPALILYHPSANVVERALDAFVRAGREDFLPIAEQLQGNANPTVHAALVRARSALRPDEEYLRAMLQSFCRATRTTAAVYLHALAITDEATARAQLNNLRDHENGTAAELAIAQAAPHAHPSLVLEIIGELSSSPDERVARAAIEAMGRIGDARLVEVLVPQLLRRRHRQLVLDVLPALGKPALDELARSLSDPNTSNALRRELPRAIGMFAPIEAVPILLQALGAGDGMVDYRVIQQLEAMQSVMPDLANSPHGWGPGSEGRACLDREVEGTLRQSLEPISQRLVLEAGVQEDPARATDEQYFLVRLLRDKQVHAEERLIRLIGLEHPEEDFATIWRGLQSTGRLQASSQELIDNLLVAPLRAPVVALFGDVSDAHRLAVGRDYYTPADQDYGNVLAALVDSPSESVSALAVAQIGALRLTAYRSKLEAVPAAGTMLSEVIQQALALLSEPVPTGGGA